MVYLVGDLIHRELQTRRITGIASYCAAGALVPLPMMAIVFLFAWLKHAPSTSLWRWAMPSLLGVLVAASWWTIVCPETTSTVSGPAEQ